MVEVGPALIPFLVVGPLLVLGYNFELFGGAIHNDIGFAASWGAFPVLVAYVAQTGDLALAPVLAAGGAFALSAAQRALSTPARLLRRRTAEVSGSIVLTEGDDIRSTGPRSSPRSSERSEPCRGRSCCWPPPWPWHVPAMALELAAALDRHPVRSPISWSNWPANPSTPTSSGRVRNRAGHIPGHHGPWAWAPTRRSLHRAVLLTGRASGRRFVYAVSTIAGGRLPFSARRKLETSSEPIGRVLRPPAGALARSTGRWPKAWR